MVCSTTPSSLSNWEIAVVNGQNSEGMCQGGKPGTGKLYVYVAPPTPVGAWSMALGLLQRFEYYYYYYAHVMHMYMKLSQLPRQTLNQIEASWCVVSIQKGLWVSSRISELGNLFST